MIYIPIGISGSGKSSYFRHIRKKRKNVFVISADIIREKIMKRDKVSQDIMHTNPKYIKETWSSFFKDLKTALNTKIDLYIDNTNLPRNRRDELYSVINAHKKRRYDSITFLVFLIDPKKAIKRDLERGKKGEKVVGKDVILRQVKAFEYPSLDEVSRLSQTHNVILKIIQNNR